MGETPPGQPARRQRSVRRDASAPSRLPLEGNFVVVVHGRAGRRAAARRFAVTAAAAVAATFVIALLLEHLHVLGDDLGAVLLHAGFLVVPAFGADRTFDEDKFALAQILAADLGQLAPGHDVVP